MKAILIIARRELRAMFDHPTGYILLVVFVALNNFLFFRSAFLMGVASMRPMLEVLPWLLLMFVPAVTMRALAEDVRAGTIEVVLAQPVSELEVLLGKYLGQVLFIWLGLALTVPIPLGLSLGADLPVGVMVAQYAGAALLAAAFAAIGVWASSLGRNQVTAFIVGVAVMFLFLMIGLGPVLMGAPPAIGAVLARLAVLAHFASIARGVIDLRDVIYFVSLVAAFLVLAYGSLMSRKLAPRGRVLARLRMGTVMLVLTVVVVNLFGRRIGGRLDLTPGKAYTLSPATKAILANLPDLVTIRFFVSDENALPPEVTLDKRDVDDLLADFREAGGGNVRLVVLDPADDPAIAEEAQSLGVPAVQFSVSRKSEFEVKEGYFGLAVEYADQHETIPAIQGTDDLEYRMASFIRGLTRESRSTVGLYVEPPPMGQQQGATYSGLEAALGEGFDVRRITLETDSLDPGDLSVLVLAGEPQAMADSVADKFARFFDGGGGALVMGRGMQMQAVRNQMMAVEGPVGWNRMLQPFGVRIQSDMVFDLASNHPASMRGSFGNVLVSYPFWLRSLSTHASNINRDIASVFLPWTSSIDTTGAAPGSITPLLATSLNAGAEETAAMIDPQRTDFPPVANRPLLTAVQVNPTASSVDSAPSGRLVVVGNPDFASDKWAGSARQNVAFALNAVDWLAQEEGLIAIRAKDRSPPTLVFEGERTADLIHYGNLIGVPFLLSLFGAFRLLRRKRLTRRSYVAGTESVAA
jgi:ABC-type uncharacterized transport system involved in gliding motility auxiliary subunit/ABC-type transport system involved in multi-copper enzyme maturation permease subunit